jgi:hypothetical protein
VFIWYNFRIMLADAFSTKAIPFDRVLTFCYFCYKLIDLGKERINGATKNMYESNVKLN